MRVLVTTTPWVGHLFPMVPLAWALRADGHDVRVAVQPGFMSAATATALPAVAIGHDVDIDAIWRDVVVTPGRRTDSPEHRRTLSTVGTRMFAAVAEAMAGDLIELAREWRADLIIHEPVAYAGTIAAQVLSIPSVRHLWGLDSPYLQREPAEPLLLPLWQKFGLDTVDQFGRFTLDPCPPSVQVPVDYRRRTVRYVPHNGPGAVPGWMSERTDRPRVCVTWGTTFASAAGHLSPAQLAVQGLADLPLDVVVAAPSTQLEALGEMPPHVRVAESIPLQLLMPRCDAIVHVGGSGTAFTAAVHAVPQLVMPAFADGPLNARRLTEAGVARGLAYGDASPEEIARNVTILLEDPTYRDNARRLQEEILAQPSPAAVAAELADLALVGSAG